MIRIEQKGIGLNAWKLHQYLVMRRGEVVQRGRGTDIEAEGVQAWMSI
jgi:hypothetical protein